MLEFKVDYVEALQEKMKSAGFTIPGKDLSNPAIAEELLKYIEAYERGESAPIRFNDSHNTIRPVVCGLCKDDIPKYESYLYLTDDSGEEEPFHHQCYPWPNR